MTGREKLNRLADQLKRDAFTLAEQGNEESALIALENYMQCLAISMLRDEPTCGLVYDAILKNVPSLIPS
jgi:hypothetical protein